LIDGVIPEPKEGAHRNLEEAASMMSEVLDKALNEVLAMPVEKLLKQREQRLRQMGEFAEG